jgi:hypothetical protein
MTKNLRNSILLIISLSAIGYWLFTGLNKKIEPIDNQIEKTNNSDLIFKLLQKDSTLKYDSLIGVESIAFSDSSNFINILKKQQTQSITIGEIAPYSTIEFLSVNYKASTLNNYKTYLKNNNQFQEWDSINKSLKTDFNFNVSELATYINEIGSFTSNTSTFYYLKSEEAYNVVSLLNFIMDSITPQISKRLLYYKINTDNLFHLLAGNLFTESKSYYINTGDYFIFGSDTTELSYMYFNLKDGNTLQNNPLYIHYKSKQFSDYGINYYYNITTKNDTINTILSYQLRGEKNGVITNFNLFQFEKIKEILIDSTFIDSMQIDSVTEEEQLINQIVEQTQESQEHTKVGEITYHLLNGESFRESTVKLKLELEKGGYDYNKVKLEHVYFIVNNGNKKLDWNTAVNRYLDKKQPQDGDYFFMKKFFY